MSLTWNIENAVKYITRNAEPKSLAKCAGYVRKAIEAGGISTLGRPGSAYKYSQYLPSIGFNKIADITGRSVQKEWSNRNAQKGDISVMAHGEHGHICMWNGRNWVSDFIQQNMWVYKGDGRCEIFRFNGTITENVNSSGGMIDLEYNIPRYKQDDNLLIENFIELEKQIFALILEGEGVVCTKSTDFKDKFALMEDTFYKNTNGTYQKGRINLLYDKYTTKFDTKPMYSQNLSISEFIVENINNSNMIVPGLESYATMPEGDGTQFDPKDCVVSAKGVNVFGNTKYTRTRKGPIKYLVIHYTAGANSKPGAAKSVCEMWVKSPRAASADFVVDDGTMWQYTPDPAKYACFAVGKPKPGVPYNMHNCVSIEVCSTFDKKRGKNINNANDPGWYFTSATLGNALGLAKELMKKYNIPLSNVIRHYDVSGKLCPGIIGWNKESGNDNEWFKFKNTLA